MSSAAASPFKGSVGLGYKSSWGRNVSKTFSKSAKQISSLWFTQFLQYARRIHHDSVQVSAGLSRLQKRIVSRCRGKGC